MALWWNARALFNFTKDQFAALLLLALPLTLNTLNNGQANIVLVVLCLVATAAAAESRWLLCAGCAAFAIYWKLYPIALALLLIVIFPQKLTIRVVLAVLVLLAFSFLLHRPSYVLDQYGSWITNLVSDQRRELEYYGKNRDFYLLLRLIGLPITIFWWTVLQLLAAITAAGICLLAKSRRHSAENLLFLTMCIAIVWMLLFGPATEATTYVLIAVPAAYLVLTSWSTGSLTGAAITSIIIYIGFIAAEVVTSWLGIKRNVYLVHAMQPTVALGFSVALFYWWRQRALTSEGPTKQSLGRAAR